MADQINEVNERLLDQKLESDLTEVDIPDTEEPENQESNVPLVWDPRELDFYRNHVESERPDEIQDFAEDNEQAFEQTKDIKPDDYSRWEERFLISHHQTLSLEELSERTGRSEEETKSKLASMGILSNIPE